MEIVLPIAPGFSFYQTMHAHGWRFLKPYDWKEDSQILERIERLEDGRVVKWTLSTIEKMIVIHSDPAAPPDEIARKVKRMLQLDLDLSEFHRFCHSRPELAHIPRAAQGRMLCSPSLWEDVCKVILTTNTTWTQTKAMTARLIDEFGEPWPPDPIRKAFPTPARIAAVPAGEFAARAKLGYRAPALHALAADIVEGRTDLDSLLHSAEDDAALWKRLLALRGVGPYAAACLLLYVGRPGRVNVDSWARMLLSKELGRPVADKEVHAFFADYGEWRGLVYQFYAWKEEKAGTASSDVLS